MPKSSPTSPSTVLTVAMSDSVDLVRLAVTEAAATDKPWSAQSLWPFWRALPYEDLVAGFLGRLKAAPHLAPTVRKQAKAALTDQAETLWVKQVQNVWAVEGQDGPATTTAEDVAGQFVHDYVSSGLGGIWFRVHEAASQSYWQGRLDDDGRITVGQTPTGRRRRADLPDVIEADSRHALDQLRSLDYGDLHYATRTGAWRRTARAQRMACGLTQQQAQFAIWGRGAIPFGYTGWETDTRREHPRGFSWAAVAQGLALDPDLTDNGPQVPHTVSQFYVRQVESYRALNPAAYTHRRSFLSGGPVTSD